MSDVDGTASDIVMPYIVMAYIVMAYIVLAYIVMAWCPMRMFTRLACADVVSDL